jgi:7-carboxy-7-deazaguanine synthase
MQPNRQTPELPVRGDGSTLAVHSIFHTIQGEGPHSGKPAVFIRLAGCNLQCPMCDTEYTEGRKVLDIDDVCKSVMATLHRNPASSHVTPCSLVVITGGEPMRQPIGRLVRKLITAYGFSVQIETNGTLFQPTIDYMDKKLMVVCSPKTHVVHRMLLPHIAAFKYVATRDSLNPSDGLPDVALGLALSHWLYRPGVDFPRDRIYLQPVDELNIQANADNLAAVVESCLRFGYRLCLQTHKLIGVP